MLFVTSFAAVAFAFGTAKPMQTVDTLPPATEILAKTEAALGDVEKRSDPKAIVMKGTMKTGGPGSPHEQVFMGKDRVRITTTFGDQAATQGQTPEFCWSTDQALGITIREGKDRAGVARGYAIERRAPWTELYSAAKTIGKTKIDGRDHFELEMTPKEGGDPDRWFVDAVTSLPTAFGTLLPDPQSGTIGVRFVFSEWEDFGGVKFPYEKRIEISGISLAIVYDSIAITEFVEDSQIAPPDAVLAAFADPSKRSKQAGKSGDYTIEDVAEQTVLSIRTTIPEKEVSKSLAKLYPEIMRYAMKSGSSPVAPPFARFHKIENGEIDFEAGIAVSGNPTGEGRVKASKLPGGKAAVTWHIGPYEKLPATCTQLGEWMQKEGHRASGGYWEIYWTDPGIEPDASKWRTQVIWPIDSK